MIRGLLSSRGHGAWSSSRDNQHAIHQRGASPSSKLSSSFVLITSLGIFPRTSACFMKPLPSIIVVCLLRFNMFELSAVISSGAVSHRKPLSVFGRERSSVVSFSVSLATGSVLHPLHFHCCCYCTPLLFFFFLCRFLFLLIRCTTLCFLFLDRPFFLSFF